MRRYISYFRYLFRHKWYVLVECFKAGIYWRGITHDLSKFLPDELLPYARFFYNSDGSHRVIKHIGYSPVFGSGDEAFDRAWLRHQNRNEHHWQYWALMLDDGGMAPLEMSWAARTEMICDWRGAGRAQGFGDNTVEWYKANAPHMILENSTRFMVEFELDLRHPIIGRG